MAFDEFDGRVDKCPADTRRWRVCRYAMSHVTHTESYQKNNVKRLSTNLMGELTNALQTLADGEFAQMSHVTRIESWHIQRFQTRTMGHITQSESCHGYMQCVMTLFCDMTRDMIHLCAISQCVCMCRVNGVYGVWGSSDRI